MKRWLNNTSSIIMVIGNASPHQATVITALHTHSYQTIPTNYIDGVKHAIETRPHLILIDLTQPNYLGYEAWHRLRLNSDTRLIPIILLTNDSDEIFNHSGYMTDEVDYILTPIRPKELLFRVHKQLQNRCLQVELGDQLVQASTALDKAQTLAEVAQTAKKMLLAHASHELRTPLSTILGYAELLRSRTAVNSQFTKFHNDLQKISDSGYQLLDTIDTLLKISYLDRRSINLYCEDVQIKTLLNETFYSYQDQFATKGITLRKPIVAPNIALHTDSGLLKQALNKLIGNALKFTDTGEVKIEVKAKNIAGHPPRIDFEIHDTGIGIVQDKLETIFEAFELDDHSLTKSRSGLGLGLTLVKKISSVLQGEIYVQSEVGKGSIFIFSLPVSIEKAQKKRRVPHTTLDYQSSAVSNKTPQNTLSSNSISSHFV